MRLGTLREEGCDQKRPPELECPAVTTFVISFSAERHSCSTILAAARHATVLGKCAAMLVAMVAMADYGNMDTPGKG